MKTILEVLVNDRPGVLDRIVGLIRRRSWNINSLTAGDLGSGLSQITLLLEGRDVDIASLGEYLSELDAVQQWQELTEETHMLRELLLFTVPDAGREAALRRGARMLATQDGVTAFEYTDVPSQVDEYVKLLRAEGVHCLRSGPLPLIAREGDAADA